MQAGERPLPSCLIGIDLGATSLRVARVDTHASSFVLVPTPARSAAETTLISTVRILSAGYTVDAVGLSRAPGLDSLGLVADWPSRNDWLGLPLLSWLRRAATTTIVSADDGEAATLWEHAKSHPAASPSVTACVSIGSGVAIGIMSGDVLRATGDGSRSLSHEAFGDLDIPCRCGKRGCLQTILSVEGIESILATNRLPVLYDVLDKFLMVLKHRFQVTRLLFTGGGVNRFSAELLESIVGRRAQVMGMDFAISKSPALSGLAGALLLATRPLRDQQVFWRLRIWQSIEHAVLPLAAITPA